MNVPVLCNLSNEECCTLCYLAFHLEQVEQDSLIRDVTKLMSFSRMEVETILRMLAETYY